LNTTNRKQIDAAPLKTSRANRIKAALDAGFSRDIELPPKSGGEFY